jgi:vitamin B12 transporter
MRLLSSLSLLMAATAGQLAAQRGQDTMPELKEIVVTADRVETPLARSVSAVTVISGEELRVRGIHFVEEALSQVPGAMVVPTGSYGGTSSLFMRGGESDYVKVLIDGVAVNQPGGAFNFGTLTTDNIERIEVVRGPASVLYGSDAMTGVVQIITRRGRGPVHARASSRAGTYGTWEGDVGVSGGSEQASYSASLSRFHTDGIYQFNSAYGSTVGSAAITVRPDGHTDLTLTARTGHNLFHFPTDFAGAVVDSNQQSRQNGTTLGLDFGLRFNPWAELRVQLASHRETDESSDLPDSPGDSLGFYFQSQGRILRQSFDARGIVQATSRVRLTAGALVEVEDLEESNGGGPPFGASRHNVGAYGQGMVTLGTGTILNIGLRLDDNQKFGNHATYRLGAVHSITTGLRIRAAIGSGFKEPSIRENYANTAFEIGNPKLKPEESRSWDAGVEKTFFRGGTTVSVSYFQQRFRNLIQYNSGAAPGSPNYENIGHAKTRGVELVGQFRQGRNLILTGSYTYLWTDVDDAGFSTGTGGTFEQGKPLVRRPAHSARVGARGRPMDRVGVGAALNYVGNRDDIDFGSFPAVRTTLPHYVTVDGDFSFDILRQAAGRPALTATLRAANLFDENYQTVFGFKGRGRAVFVGGSVGF